MRGLNNWTPKDVKEFLLAHDFSPTKKAHKRSNYSYYQRWDSKTERCYQTFVPTYKNNLVPVGTLQNSIIPQSGISKEVWKDWANGKR